jgi:hypothetical protein
MWNVPNELTNCEDILMNFLVASASGLPQVPFEPVFRVQDDFGCPPLKSLEGYLSAQLHGLSGTDSNASKWHDKRASCSKRLLGFFGNDSRLLQSAAMFARAPWKEIAFRKKYLLHNGKETSTNLSHVTRREQELIDATLTAARKKLGTLTAAAQKKTLTKKVNQVVDNSWSVPVVTQSTSCPKHVDIINTERKQRWTIWSDDKDCKDACHVPWCKVQPETPCCVKRLKAEFSVDCSQLPHGCHVPRSEDSWDGRGRVLDFHQLFQQLPNMNGSKVRS